MLVVVCRCPLNVQSYTINWLKWIKFRQTQIHTLFPDIRFDHMKKWNINKTVQRNIHFKAHWIIFRSDLNIITCKLRIMKCFTAVSPRPHSSHSPCFCYCNNLNWYIRDYNWDLCITIWFCVTLKHWQPSNCALPEKSLNIKYLKLLTTNTYFLALYYWRC